MRNRLLPLVAAAFVAVAASVVSGSPAQAQTEIYGFQTPTKNINCTYYPFDGEPPYMECMVGTFTGKAPAKPSDCDLDWTAQAGIGKSGAASLFGCRGDTSWWPDAPVLNYGSTWKKGPFSCSIAKTGVTCKNTSKKGFFVSKSSIKRV